MAQPKKFDPKRPNIGPEFKHPLSITARHIEMAAGTAPCSERSQKYHRRRIREWGRLNREFLRNLGVRFVKKAA